MTFYSGGMIRMFPKLTNDLPDVKISVRELEPIFRKEIEENHGRKSYSLQEETWYKAQVVATSTLWDRILEIIEEKP